MAQGDIKVPQENAVGTYDEIVLPNIPTKFIQLTDTPSTYTGANGNIATVDEANQKIIFAAPTVPGHGHTATMSITGDGTPAAPFRFTADEATPTALKYYGTNAAGAKGYHLLPAAAEADMLTNLNNRVNVIPFSMSFPAVPIGVSCFKIYRMVYQSGIWVVQDVLHGHANENWVTVDNFEFIIDDSELLAGVIVEYSFKTE